MNSYLYSATKSKDIPFLQSENTLYTIDMRAASEGLDYDIPANWSYENLLPWIVKGHLAVNEHARDVHTKLREDTIIAPKGKLARESLYSRLPKPSEEIKHLWVGVAHPDADAYAERLGLTIQEKYADFLRRNSKRNQKELLGEVSPSWSLDKPADVTKVFIKRYQGSGGYTVFPGADLDTNTDFQKLYTEDPTSWYYENAVLGTPYSIQCFQDQGIVTIYGYTKQLIEDGTHFSGSLIMPLEQLKSDTRVRLETALDRLKPLMDGYTGFFGIDFMIDEQGIAWVLEANVRMTSATIPVLFCHDNRLEGAIFQEYQDEVPKGATILSQSCDTSDGMHFDILSPLV